MSQEAWVPSAEHRGPRWGLLGIPRHSHTAWVTQYIQLSAARCGRGWHPGLGRAAGVVGFKQRGCRGGREDCGVRVLQLEANVNIRLS